MGHTRCSIRSALGQSIGTRPLLHDGKRCTGRLYPENKDFVSVKCQRGLTKIEGSL